jgi:methylmalonyl-CoA epimerase
MKIEHIGVATRSIASASRIYEALGMKIGSVEEIEEQKVKAALIRIGETAVELLEATDIASPIARHIEKRGEGIHHIAIEVENLSAKLEVLRAKGFELIDSVPRKGVGDTAVAFIHPRSTGGVLIELCQPTGGTKA